MAHRSFADAMTKHLDGPTRIVTCVHRPKRPPPKRKATALQAPAIVRKAKSGNDTRQREAEHLPAAEKKPAIVTARRRGQTADAPDITPEEFQRRADAADALWVELVRRATSKDRASG
jgi:hypothetical protein